jgi:hypothetical protein
MKHNAEVGLFTKPSEFRKNKGPALYAGPLLTKVGETDHDLFD